MDMVCEKRPDVEHDFTKDGLNLSVKDGYVSANGTTLGGDDGIAVAYSLALLDSTDIPHPALEVLVTVDEEIGLLGAFGLDCRILKQKEVSGSAVPEVFPQSATFRFSALQQRVKNFR